MAIPPPIQAGKVTRIIPSLLLSVGLLVVFSVRAHSPEEVLRELREKEPYLQLADREAAGVALEDPDGRKVALADFRGKVVILTIIYARCTDVCPLHSELIARIQGQVNATPMHEQVQFITVATDTEDGAATAQLLRAHGKAHGLDPANWMFPYRGAGTPEAGIQLAKAYGLEFTQAAESVQMHGVVTHVIDQEGILRARFHGLKVQPLRVTTFVNTLLYSDHHGAGATADVTPPIAARAPEPGSPWPGEIFVQTVLGASFAFLGIGWLAMRRCRRQRRRLTHGGPASE